MEHVRFFLKVKAVFRRARVLLPIEGMNGMNNQGQPLPDEESPGLRGPDYVALVIEWEEPVAPVESAAGSGASVAPRSSTNDLSDDNPIWSRVDEASDESFPASDPPAWGSSHAVAQEGVPEDISDQVTTPFENDSHLSRLKRFALGFTALVAMLSMIEGLRRIRRHA